LDHGQQLLLRRSGRRGCAALLHLLGRNGSRGPRRVGLFHLFIVSCILWWYPWPELTRKWLGGALSDVEYQDAKAEFNAKIAAIEQEQRLLESERAALECFVSFGELLSMDIAQAWRMAAPDQRQRVQNLLFQDGLDYSPERGILNHSNSSLFSTLETLANESALLASPTGFEPVLPP
jgi:hypothetical protein